MFEYFEFLNNNRIIKDDLIIFYNDPLCCIQILDTKAHAKKKKNQLDSILF